MPITGAGLMLCDACGARVVVALTMTKQGMLAEKVPGWELSQKRLVQADQSPVECICPECVKKAASNGESTIDPGPMLQ